MVSQLSDGTHVMGFILRARDSREAISKLGQELLRAGFVEEGFIESTLERESKFPTGLPTPGERVALPHTDGIYVKEPAIAVGVLDKPVLFGQMGSPDKQLEVKIVCMLAINRSEYQVELLRQLATLFQNGAILERIAQATDLLQLRKILVQALESIDA